MVKESQELVTGFAPHVEFDTPLTTSELALLISESGLNPRDFFAVIDPYEEVDKNALLDKPFWIRSVRFVQDKVTERPFVFVRLVTDDDKFYWFTDGSTGIYAQIRNAVNQRIASEHPRPEEFFRVNKGLRVSEYGVMPDKSVVPSGTPGIESVGRTYYLA